MDSLVTWRFLKNLDGCPSKEDTNESFNGFMKRGDDSSIAGKDELMARGKMMEFDVFFGDPSKSFALRQCPISPKTLGYSKGCPTIIQYAVSPSGRHVLT